MNIKKLVFSLIFCFCAFISHAQETSVEKSLWGVQIGLGGPLSLHNEFRLSDQFSLRSEIGIEGHYTIEKGKDHYLFNPYISVAPRWYYNLHKRVEKSKYIGKNSGNFLSLETTMSSSLFLIHNYDGEYDNSEVGFSTSLMWGIRRNIGEHFNFEFAVGPKLILGDGEVYKDNSWHRLDATLRLRVGYVF